MPPTSDTTVAAMTTTDTAEAAMTTTGTTGTPQQDGQICQNSTGRFHGCIHYCQSCLIKEIQIN